MSVRTPLVALVACAALSACGRPGPSNEPAPTPADAPAAPAEAMPAPAQAAAGAPAPAPTLSGQEVVEQICSQCHSMEPPPLAAPPLTHLATHLRQVFETEDEAVAHVVAYAPAPNAETSIMPPMAVERFGLMPPQPLPEPLLEAAARYIWSLAAEGADAEPMRMQRRRGGGGTF